MHWAWQSENHKVQPRYSINHIVLYKIQKIKNNPWATAEEDYCARSWG